MVSVLAREWTLLKSDKKQRMKVVGIIPDIFNLVDDAAIVEKMKDEGRLEKQPRRGPS